MRRRSVAALIGLAAFLVHPGTGTGQQEKVYRNISSEHLERILSDLNLSYKKTSGTKEGVHFYDYEKNNFKIRLHNYNGKDLWIDALFNKIAPEEANRWNIRAKFSRAVLVKDKERETTSLENQIDCLGGVTDGMIRQFINRFDGEVSDFSKFITK
jgi:hypothetical protein